MSELGLVVNARNDYPEPEELAALGLAQGVLRTIVYRFDELDGMLTRIGNGPRVVALLNSETEGVGQNYAGWSETVGRFAGRFHGRVYAVQCGNELDLLGVPAADAAGYVNLAADTLHAAGISVILASVAGPNWPAYLESAARLLRPGAADWASLHPYGQRAAGFPAGWGFGELIDAVRTANDLSGLPVALTEFGIKVRDAGGVDGQAEYLRRAAAVVNALSLARCPFACWFAWRDTIGGPNERGEDGFGLSGEDMVARPAWFTFAELRGGQAQEPPPPVEPPESPPDAPQPRFQAGFLAWSQVQADLLGTPLEDERGGIEGFSQQLTDRGVLTWANLKRGEVYTFYELATRKRYRWNKSLTAAVEM